MNWKRGLFRLWVVATAVWLVGSAFILADDFTATMKVSETSGIPIGRNEYTCLMNKDACPNFVTRWETAPNWGARIGALLVLFAPPIVVPLVGWALVLTATWIARGFRQGRVS